MIRIEQHTRQECDLYGCTQAKDERIQLPRGGVMMQPVLPDGWVELGDWRQFCCDEHCRQWMTAALESGELVTRPTREQVGWSPPGEALVYKGRPSPPLSAIEALDMEWAGSL